MNNTAILVFAVLLSNSVFGAVTLTTNSHTGSQVGQTEAYYTGKFISATQSVPTNGLSLAAGWDLDCDDSLTLKGGSGIAGQYSSGSAGGIYNHYPTGWTNWNSNTYHSCVTNWTYSWGSGVQSISGGGFSITLSVSSSTTGHVVGSMYKPEGEGGTPIVIDIKGNGFDFTSYKEGVWFDIDADDIEEHISWTESTSDEAFLFLDYFENGLVDGGHELFGDHATLLSGEVSPHGYAALAELDMQEYGGNEDGFISNKDKYFQLLGAWIDSNHNGISEESEIARLRDIGIDSIGYETEVIDWTDEHGNTIFFCKLG